VILYVRGSQKVRFPVLFLWKWYSTLWLCCTFLCFSCYQMAGLFTSADKAHLPGIGWTMVTVLIKWTKEKLWSVIHFFWEKGMQPMEIHCQLVTVYGPIVMAVQHVWKWCSEFGNGQISIADEQRSGRPSTSAKHVEGHQCSSAGRQACVSCAVGTEIESFTWHSTGHCSWVSRLLKGL
jgi:hypothetical protein